MGRPKLARDLWWKRIELREKMNTFERKMKKERNDVLKTGLTTNQNI